MPRRHMAQLGLPRGRRHPRAPEAMNGHGYPRPMMCRGEWESLNGRWAFAIDQDGRWQTPEEVQFSATIEVPFPPESKRSGVGDTGLYRCCWYQREIETPELRDDERLLLHFGAIDYESTVWIDGRLVARHEGGYTPFEIDISTLVRSGRRHQLVVRAEDDPADLAKPRGKQDWRLTPHSIWYPRTTGIWQTVWLEKVPANRIAAIRWTPNLSRWEIGLDARVTAPPEEGNQLVVRMHVDELLLAEDRYTVIAGEVHRSIALSDPGIDDFRNELLWSPSSPRLIEIELELSDREGRAIDSVQSYTALRSFSLEGDRVVLNGRPCTLRMVLDQGYWPETGQTPPSDAAIKRDVELTKAMGFNGARKHQKVEDPRYLYWADRLGLLVWAEMPSAYRFTERAIERFTKQWIEVIRRDASHPSIVAWVPFNESWGVPNLPENKPERHWVEAIYHLTKTLDPTRPVIGNDGWESVATDIVGIHDYDPTPDRLRERYATHDLVPKILKRERPGGRALVLDPARIHDHPMVLSEFGGIALGEQSDKDWGYSRCRTPEELAAKYTALLKTVGSLELFTGFCYTQFTDTYQEANGLLYADRTPKFPLEQIRRATLGSEERVLDNVTEREGAPE
jgi:hypothetical protein